MPKPPPERRRGVLSPREIEVLEFLTRPHGTYKTAAEALGISVFTVASHVRSIREKLGVATIAQATRRLIEDETVPFGIVNRGE